MKKFVAIEFAKSKRWKLWFNVYRVTDNELVIIWEWEYRPWMTKWADSEVMSQLAIWNYIDKGYIDKYYEPRKQDDFQIQYITPYRPM